MTKRDGGTYYWSTRDRLYALLLALPMRSAGKPNAVIFGTRNNDCHNRQVNTPVKLQPNSLRPSIQISSMSSAGPFTSYISTPSDFRIITLCISRPSLTYTTILTLTRSPTSIGTLESTEAPIQASGNANSSTPWIIGTVIGITVAIFILITCYIVMKPSPPPVVMVVMGGTVRMVFQAPKVLRVPRVRTVVMVGTVGMVF